MEREYSAELRERHRASRKNTQQRPITEGEIVIHEDNVPQNFWRLGRIEAVLPGKDGIVRGVTVKVHAKPGKTKLMHRPIQRLYPLEITRNEEDTRNGEDTRIGEEDTCNGEDTRIREDTRNGEDTYGILLSPRPNEWYSRPSEICMEAIFCVSQVGVHVHGAMEAGKW